MDIQEQIIQGQLQQINHLSKSIDYFEKSHKKGVLGEIREWSSGKYKKTPEGWVHVTDLTKKSTLAEEFLIELDPFIKERVEELVKWEEEAYAKKGIIKHVSDYDKEMFYLGTVSKLMRSIGQYAKPTDKLEDVDVMIGKGGEAVVRSTISREGQKYYLSTWATGAGGYNIQSYHLRYLTDTNLPKLKVESGLEKPYEDRIKKLTKAEKIQKEIGYYENYIKQAEETIKQINSMSDDELLDTHPYYKRNERPTWEKVVANGAAKNFNNKKEKFEASEKEYRDSSLKGLRDKVPYNIERIKSLKKDLAKQKAKLEEVLK